MSYQQEIEAITSLSIDGSSSPNTTEIGYFEADGSKEVVNRIIALRPQESYKFASTSAPSDDGVDIDGQIISVVREHDSATILRSCSKMNPNERYDASQSSSLNYRSDYNPGYYILDGKLYTVPAADEASDNGVIVTQVAYPANYSGLPSEYQYLAVLYGAQQALIAYMGSLDAALPSAIVLPVLPSAPSLSDSSISFSATTEYTAPVISLPSFPSIAWDLPLEPIAPALADATIEALGTAPEYVPPVVSPDFAEVQEWIDDDDPELAQSAQGKVTLEINKYQADLQNALNSFNELNSEYQADLAIKTQKAQLLSKDDDQKIQKYTGELQAYASSITKVVQENQSKIAEWQAEANANIQKYSAELTNSANEFNKTQVEYQGDLQKAIQEAQLVSGDDAQKIQNYGIEVQEYSANVQAVVADFNAALQKEGVKYQWAQARYTAIRQQYNDAFGLMAPAKQKGDK